MPHSFRGWTNFPYLSDEALVLVLLSGGAVVGGCVLTAVGQEPRPWVHYLFVDINRLGHQLPKLLHISELAWQVSKEW